MSIWETALFSPTLVLLTQYSGSPEPRLQCERSGWCDGVASNGPAPACMTAWLQIFCQVPLLLAQSQSGYTNSWAALGDIAMGDFCKTVIAKSSSSSCGNTLILHCHWEQGKSVARLGMEARPPVQEMDGPGADNSFLSILHTRDCDTLTRDTWRTWPLG